MIDSHAHLTSDLLYSDIKHILKRAQRAQIKKVVNICTDLKTLERGIELAKEYPWVYNAGATTPHDVDQEGEKYFSFFKQAAEKKLLIAVGETGLDYHYQHSKREAQQDFFVRYIELAKATDLPLIIHCRDAFEDFFSLIDAHYPLARKGVLHCFTGTLSEAKKLIERGWYISFSGIITFKKSSELREIAKYVPIENMLIETDAPYLAPQSKRGLANEPSFMPETAHMITQLKNLPLEEVIEKTSQNAEQLFKLCESTAP